jgi:hypothetical protein
MYAYAFDGSPIVSTKETIPGLCGIEEDSFGNGPGGVEFESAGGTNVDWDGQRTVSVNGQSIFVDEAGREWPGCALVLVATEIDEDSDEEEERALPADGVAAARAAHAAWKASRPFVGTIAAPSGRWPDAVALTPAERALLSPIATTLALLSGRTASDVSADPSIVDAFLPKALALATTADGTVSGLADVAGLFPSQHVPLPTVVKGRKVTDLAGGHGVALVELTDIVWDDDGHAPDLPTSMIAAVGADWDEDNGIVDLLSDGLGYCVSGVGDTTQIDRAGEPVEYS